MKVPPLCVGLTLLLATFATLSLTTGCADYKRDSEARDPNVRRARERRAASDYVGALGFYEKALEKRPGMARIHWEMASLYDQYVTNELRAVYHYERYLELDPEADRRQLVEELIAAAKLSYAASLPARPSEAVQEIARLRKEVERLSSLLAESRVATVKAQSSAAGDGRPASSSGAAPSPSLRPAPPIVTSLEEYVVKPGDTLSRIASKVYNDSRKWDIIYEANRSTLSRPESVRVGQVLMIPR